MGSLGLFLSVPRTPTTSSSGKPSPSLSAPLLSDGGPGGRGEERWAVRLLGVLGACFLLAAEGASELSIAPKVEDMLITKSKLWCSMVEV